VLLHGCCHNPTGANLTAEQMGQVITLLKANGVTPMVDIAYQGFGDGLNDDAMATRAIAAAFPEVLIAASCSKNFGIYRERTGILMAISKDADAQPLTQQTLAYLNRQNYSFPPDHGARVVTEILTDPELRADWEAELEETRNGILKTLENKGGNAPMKIIHGYSKLIHQVAHKEFSDVMEGLVNDELVIFDDGAFILTEKGKKLAINL
jgi:aspartate/tyrosine/aromatic aminotransferase